MAASVCKMSAIITSLSWIDKSVKKRNLRAYSFSLNIFAVNRVNFYGFTMTSNITSSLFSIGNIFSTQHTVSRETQYCFYVKHFSTRYADHAKHCLQGYFHSFVFILAAYFYSLETTLHFLIPHYVKKREIIKKWNKLIVALKVDFETHASFKYYKHNVISWWISHIYVGE